MLPTLTLPLTDDVRALVISSFSKLDVIYGRENEAVVAMKWTYVPAEYPETC